MPPTTRSSSQRFFGSSSGPKLSGSIERDRPGAHREYVADDPSHSRRGTLVRLHRRRVVMALDADGGGDAVSDVDYTGILAGADQYSGTLGRKPAKVNPRGLVRAVLAPHDRHHCELEGVGATTENLDEVVEFTVGEAKTAMKVRRFLHESTVSFHVSTVYSSRERVQTSWQSRADSRRTGRARPAETSGPPVTAVTAAARHGRPRPSRHAVPVGRSHAEEAGEQAK